MVQEWNRYLRKPGAIPQSLRAASILLILFGLVSSTNYWTTAHLGLVDITGDSAHVATTLFKLLDPDLFAGDAIWGGQSKFAHLYQPAYMQVLVALSSLVHGTLEQRVVFAFRAWSALAAAFYVAGLVTAFRLLTRSWWLALILCVPALAPYAFVGNEQIGLNPLSPVFSSRQIAQIPFYLLAAYVLGRAPNPINIATAAFVGLLSGVMMLLHNAAGLSIGLVVALFLISDAISSPKHWKTAIVNASVFGGVFLAVCGWILVMYLLRSGLSTDYDRELALRFWYWRFPDVFPPAHLRIYLPVAYLTGFTLLGGLYLTALLSANLRWGMYALAFHVLLWWQGYGIVPCLGLLWISAVSVNETDATPFRRAILLGFCMYVVFVPLQIGYDLVTLWLRFPPPYMDHLRNGSYILIIAYSSIVLGLRRLPAVEGRSFSKTELGSAVAATSVLAVVASLYAFNFWMASRAGSKVAVGLVVASGGCAVSLLLGYLLRNKFADLSRFFVLMVTVLGVIALFFAGSKQLDLFEQTYATEHNLALRGNNQPGFPFSTQPIDDGSTYDSGIRMLTRDELLRIPKQFPANSVVLMPETQSDLMIRNLGKVAMYLNRSTSGILFYVDKADALRAQQRIEEYTTYYRTGDWRSLVDLTQREGVTHAFVPTRWAIDEQCIASRLEFGDLSLVEFKTCH